MNTCFSNKNQIPPPQSTQQQSYIQPQQPQQIQQTQQLKHYKQQLLCKNHQGSPITHICCLEDCLQPLCGKCIKFHTQFHKQDNVFAEIETLDDIKAFCKEKLQQVSDDYKMELQLQKEIQQKEFQDSQQQTLINNQIQQLRQAKQDLIIQLDQYFNELEQAELHRQEKNNREKQQNLVSSNNLQKMIENQINQLNYEKDVLNEGNIQMEQIKGILTSDYGEKLENLKQQHQIQQQQLNKSFENLQQRQHNLYIDPQHLDRHQEFLKQMYFQKSEQKFDYLIPKKSDQKPSQIKKESQQQFQMPFIPEKSNNYPPLRQQQQPQTQPQQSLFEPQQLKNQNQQPEQQLQQQQPKSGIQSTYSSQPQTPLKTQQQKPHILNPYIQENASPTQSHLKTESEGDTYNKTNPLNTHNFDKYVPKNNQISNQNPTNQDYLPQKQQQQYKHDFHQKIDDIIQQNEPFQVMQHNTFFQGCNKVYAHFFQHKSKIFHFVNLEDLGKGLEPKFYSMELAINFKIPRWHRSIALPDGTVILTGGVSCEVKDQKLNTVYALNMEKKTLFSMPPMRLGRSGHVLVLLQDELYAIGGLSQYQNFTTRCEKYNFKSRQWQEIAPLNQNSNNPCACSFNDQYIYKFGGKFDDFTLNKVVEKYDPKFNRWEIIKFYIPQALSHNSLLLNLGACCQINETEILVFGGTHEEYSQKSDQCYIFKIEKEQPEEEEIQQYIQQYRENQSQNNQQQQYYQQGQDIGLSAYIQNQLSKKNSEPQDVYSIIEFNKNRLPEKDGFWNNQVYVYNGNLYCLQNVSGNNQQCVVNLDRRRLLKFDSKEWISLNDQQLNLKDSESQIYQQQQSQ